MAQYLHIRVDDIDLLLPALQVHEVIGLEDQEHQAEGHTLWRDRAIAVRDLGQLLQRCVTAPSRAYGVVYSADNTDASPLLMTIDQVMGLRNPLREQLHRLPGAKNTAHSWFDAIWIDNQLGLRAYCMKAQLSTDLLDPI